MNVSEIKKTLVEKLLSIEKLYERKSKEDDGSKEDELYLVGLEAQIELLENLIKALF